MKKIILATYKNPFSRDAAGNIDVLINIYERVYRDDDEDEYVEYATDFIGQTRYYGEDSEGATETDIHGAVIEWLKANGIEHEYNHIVIEEHL